MESSALSVGAVTTLAGSSSAGYADGVGSSASFNGPGLIAVDSKHNVYIPEWTNHRIRKLNPYGAVTTWIGNGNKAYGDGVGTNASLYSPYGCVVDSYGYLYISDAYNRRVRKVTPAGEVSTLIGNGTDAFVPGTGTRASIRYPTGLAVDTAQNLYVCDSWARRICKVSPDGEMKPFAGSGVQGTSEGMGTSAQFDYPTGIAVDLQSNLYVCDYNQCVIRKVAANGLVSTFAGSRRKATVDGTGTFASFNGPNSVAIDADNNLYVCELDGCRIRKVTFEGAVTTITGNTSKQWCDGVGTSASWSGPFGVTVDDDNNLLIADGQRIRRVKGEVLERSSERLYNDLVESNVNEFIKIARQCGYLPPSQTVKSFTVRSDIDSDMNGTDSLKHLKKDIASLSSGFYPAETSLLRAQVTVLRKIHRLLDVDTDKDKQRVAKMAKNYLESHANSPAVTKSSQALQKLMDLFCLALAKSKKKEQTNDQVLAVLRTLISHLPPQPAVVPANSIDLYRSFFPILRSAATAKDAPLALINQSISWYFRLALAVGSVEQMADLALLLITHSDTNEQKDLATLLKPLESYNPPAIDAAGLSKQRENEKEEGPIDFIPSTPTERARYGLLILRHLARISAPFSVPADGKLMFSEPLALELTSATFTTLLLILKHAQQTLNSNQKDWFASRVTTASLQLLQVQLIHLKRARDVDVGPEISADTRAALWTLLFTTLPNTMSGWSNESRPIMKRLQTLIEQSFTVLAPTVSQLTSMSDYLNHRSDGPKPVANEFSSVYFRLLVDRFSTFRAGVSLVQDLHSDPEDSVYSKKLAELNAVIHPLLGQIADKKISASSLKLCVHFQSALFHYIERNFIAKIESATAAAAAAGIPLPSASPTAASAAAASDSKDVKSSAPPPLAKTQSTLTSLLPPAPSASSLFKAAFVNAIGNTVTSYARAVIESCTKLFGNMKGRAFPSLGALDTELCGAAQLYRPLLSGLSFVLPHLNSDVAISVLVPLLQFARASRDVEAQTAEVKSGAAYNPGGRAAPSLNATMLMNTDGTPVNDTKLSITVPSLSRQQSFDKKGGSDEMRPALISTTAMSLCAQCCGRLLKSDPTPVAASADAAVSASLTRWLESPLVAGGLLYGNLLSANAQQPKSLSLLLSWLRDQKIQLPEDLPADPSLEKEAKFVASLIGNTGAGAALVKKLKQYVKDNRMLPGSTVATADQTCRTLFACSLHHNHRLQLAMIDADGNDPPHSVVSRLWAKSIAVRGVVAMWKSQGGETAMKAMLESYMARAAVLLKIHPAALAEVPSSSLHDVKPSPSPKLKRFPSLNDSKLGNETEKVATTEKVLKSKRWLKIRAAARLIRFTFQAIWRLKRLINFSLGPNSGGAGAAGGGHAKDIHALVNDFLLDSAVDTDALWGTLLSERARAMNRLAVFIFLQQLVRDAKTSELSVVLKEISEAFRFETSSSLSAAAVATSGGANANLSLAGIIPVTHYMDKLGAVGPDYKLLLSQSYFAFLSHLAHMDPYSPSAMCTLLDLANLEYDAADLRQLHMLNLPRIIFSLASFPGANKLVLNNPFALSEMTNYGKKRLGSPWNVRFACFQLFRLMCNQSMHHQKSNLADSDPTIHSLRQSLLSCLFSHLQTIWQQRSDAPRMTKPIDGPMVWTCEECSFTNEVGVPNCSVCRAPFGDIHMHFLESKQPTPVNWAQRELKVHYGDLGLAWFRSDLIDVTPAGKPIRRLEPPSLFEFNVYANQLLWIVLHCVEYRAARALLAENRSWVRFLLTLASIKSLPSVGADPADAAAVAAVDVKTPAVAVAPMAATAIPMAAVAVAATPMTAMPAMAMAVPAGGMNDSKLAAFRQSATPAAMLALPPGGKQTARPSGKGPMMAMAAPAMAATATAKLAVNADTTPSSLQSAILATRILRYVIPSVPYIVDLIHEQEASTKSPRATQAEFLFQMLRGIAPGSMSVLANLTPDVSTRQGELVCLYRSLLGSQASRDANRESKEKRREKNNAELNDDAEDDTATTDGGDTKQRPWERASRDVMMTALKRLQDTVPNLIALTTERKHLADGCRLIEDKYADVCGALYVLGAHLEVVREGGQVKGSVNNRPVSGILTNLTPAGKSGEKDLVMVRVEERVDIRLDDSATLQALDDVPIPFDHMSDTDMAAVFDSVGTFLLTYGLATPPELNKSMNCTLAFERLRRMALSVLRAAIPTPFFTGLLKRQLADSDTTSPSTVSITISAAPISAPHIKGAARASSPISSAAKALSLPSLLPLLLSQTFAATAAAAATESKKDIKEFDGSQLRDAPFPFIFFKNRTIPMARQPSPDCKIDVIAKHCIPGAPPNTIGNILVGVSPVRSALLYAKQGTTQFKEIRFDSIKAICMGAITASFVRFIKAPMTVKDSLCMSIIQEESTVNIETSSDNDLKMLYAQLYFSLLKAGLRLKIGRLGASINTTYPDEVTSCFCSHNRVPSTHQGCLIQYKDDTFAWIEAYAHALPPRLLLPVMETPAVDNLSQLFKGHATTDRLSPDLWYSFSMKPAVEQCAAISPEVAASLDEKASPSPASAPAHTFASHFDARVNSPFFTISFEFSQFANITQDSEITIAALQTPDQQSHIVLSAVPQGGETNLRLTVQHREYSAMRPSQERNCVSYPRAIAHNQISTLFFSLIVAENRDQRAGPTEGGGGKVVRIFLNERPLIACPLPFDFPDLSRFIMHIAPRGYIGHLRFVAIYRYAMPQSTAITMCRSSYRSLDNIETMRLAHVDQMLANKDFPALRIIGYRPELIANATKDIPQPLQLPAITLQRCMSDMIVNPAMAHADILPPGHLSVADNARQALDAATMVGLWTNMGFNRNRCLDAISCHCRDMTKALAALIDPSQVLAVPTDPATADFRRQLDQLSANVRYQVPVATINIPRTATQLPDILNRPNQMPDTSAVTAAAALANESGASVAASASSGPGKLPLYQLMLQPLARFGAPLQGAGDPAKQLLLLLAAERAVSATFSRECIMSIFSGARSTSTDRVNQVSQLSVQIPSTPGGSAGAPSPTTPSPGGPNARTSVMVGSPARPSLVPTGGVDTKTLSASRVSAMIGGGKSNTLMIRQDSDEEKPGAGATSPAGHRRSFSVPADEPDLRHAPSSLSQLLTMLNDTSSIKTPEVKISVFTFGNSANATSADEKKSASAAMEANFISRFIRVVFATNSKTDLAIMEEALKGALIAEGLHIGSGGKDHKVSSELAAELVLQLSLDILKAESYRGPQLPSTDIVFWMVELFLSVVQSLVIQKSPSAYNALTGLLFNSSIVDLMLARILISLNESVFPLMILCGRVISVRGVKFSPAQANSFNHALNRIQQNATAMQLQSPLLRTLMEFSFALLKASGGASDTKESNMQSNKIFQFESLVHWMRDCKNTVIAPALQQKLMAADGKGFSNYDEFQSCMSLFTPTADAQLVQAVNRLTAKGLTVGGWNFSSSLQSEIHHYKFLSDKKFSDVEHRLKVLQFFNETYKNILPSVNLSLTASQSFLSAAVFSSRDLVFWSTKEPLWSEAMSKTAVHIPKECADLQIRLSLFMANELMEKKKTDFRFDRSMFGQLYQQLTNKEPTIYRLDPLKRAWKVEYLGLNATDVGGPYRETLQVMTQEIQSPVLPLFVMSPNGRADSGDNRDALYVARSPSPSAALSSDTSSSCLLCRSVPRPLPPMNQSNDYYLRIAMYEFLGQFLGLAIRTQNYLPLNWPSIVWKGLVSDEITTDDVRSIDLLSFKILEDINNRLTQAGQTPDMFNAVMSDVKFCVYGSDAKIYDLIPGGSKISVTWSNRKQFVDALVKYRLNEFRTQCEAIRRGLATVVPYKNLPLLTWQELEFLVCGSKRVDVDLLQSMTAYHDCAGEDAHIKIFWQMLRDRFDDAQRAKFLQFTWGRSTMPTKVDPNVKFKIQAFSRGGHGDINRALPITHTCFFALELPKYTSLDVMTERMTYAMVNCTTIDGDSARQHDLIQTDIGQDSDPAHASLWQ